MSPVIMRRALIVVLLLFIIPAPALAQQTEPEPYGLWLRQLESDAITVGISPKTVHDALDSVTPDGRVIELDRRQPENTISFAAYSKNILSKNRVNAGKKLLAKNAAALRDIQARYGVPPQIVVALWGIESGYGRNIGNFNVIVDLATLAYEGRRADFFRQELIDALRVMDSDQISASGLRGSWAGAMGQCQFMPSTYLKYAVDNDGDGRRDIWNDKSDTFASIANYLAAEGWRGGMTWGREVRLSRHIPQEEIELQRKRAVAEWRGLGVTTVAGKSLPISDANASLIQPDGAGGRSFLVYDNFGALMRWNRSTYFATTVGLLADRISLR